MNSFLATHFSNKNNLFFICFALLNKEKMGSFITYYFLLINWQICLVAARTWIQNYTAHALELCMLLPQEWSILLGVSVGRILELLTLELFSIFAARQ